jgi:hypothetical protein
LFKYSKERSFPVILDKDRIRNLGVNVVEEDLVSKKNYLRHDSHKTAKRIINLYNNLKKNN